MKIKLRIYSLKDEIGNVENVAVNEPNDDICIGGRTRDGRYHQFDSTEAYYLGAWIASNWLPFSYAVTETEVILPDELGWYTPSKS